MRASLPNLFHIKYIKDNPNNTYTSLKYCFMIRTPRNPIEGAKISQKDPARGNPAREIRKVKMPIKKEGMATKRRWRKR